MKRGKDTEDRGSNIANIDEDRDSDTANTDKELEDESLKSSFI